MSKESGLGDNLYVGGYDLSGDIGSLSAIGGGPTALDVTGINASGYERIGGIRDGRIEYTAFFNPAAGQAHPVLSALPTTDVHLMYCRGTTQGNQAACLVSKQINYDPNRGGDGGLTFGVQAQANGYGLEWAWLMTAGKRTDTGATNGAGIGGLWAQTDFGLQAYLQVFSFAGTDVTISFEESSDNGSGDAWAAVTGGVFTEVTSGPTTERIQTARDLTVEQYLRVVTSTTGGFTSLVFAVAVVRNYTEVLFG